MYVTGEQEARFVVATKLAVLELYQGSEAQRKICLLMY
jgi:hypothetical protein